MYIIHLSHVLAYFVLGCISQTAISHPQLRDIHTTPINMPKEAEEKKSNPDQVLANLMNHNLVAKYLKIIFCM